MAALTHKIKLLKATRDPRERNRLAIELLDNRVPELSDSLVRLVQQPELRGSRGTLIYCLGKINPLLRFSLFVDLLITGSWEEAHEALDALAAIPEAQSVEVSEAIERVEASMKNCPEPWRYSILESFLEATSE